MKPFEEQDIVEKLRNRAEIRRKIGRTVDGKPDRIASTCEEAANEIERLRKDLDSIWAWKQEGDIIFAKRESTSLVFKMGMWWADRPWRNLK